MRWTACAIACLVIAACEGTPTATDRVAARSLLDDHELILHGPLPTLGQHCNGVHGREAEQLGVDEAALDFGCRTVVRAAGAELTALSAPVLGDGFLHAKLFETGGARPPAWSGHVHVALQTRRGWYVSDAVVALAKSSELADGGLADATLEARELAPGPGREVVLTATGSDGAALVGCRLDEDAEPRCIAIGLSGTRRAAFVPGGSVWVDGEEAAGSGGPSPGPYRW